MRNAWSAQQQPGQGIARAEFNPTATSDNVSYVRFETGFPRGIRRSPPGLPGCKTSIQSPRIRRKRWSKQDAGAVVFGAHRAPKSAPKTAPENSRRRVRKSAPQVVADRPADSVRIGADSPSGFRAASRGLSGEVWLVRALFRNGLAPPCPSLVKERPDGLGASGRRRVRIAGVQFLIEFVEVRT